MYMLRKASKIYGLLGQGILKKGFYFVSDDNKAVGINIKEAYFSSGADRAIGGQAVIEGVMMRGKEKCALAVRKPDSTIEVIESEVKKRSAKILKLPIIRGVISFASSLVIGMENLMKSAEIASGGIEDNKEEKVSKFEEFLINKFGDSGLTKIILYASVVIGIMFSVVLFMLLPVFIGRGFSQLFNIETWALSVIEGFSRIFIFLAYLLLVSRSKDIQRTFEYHGAEHKTINCFESGKELNIENVKNSPRLHKRCGTSFLLVVMIISMIVFLFLRTDVFWLRVLMRILLVPFIAGVSFEFIK